MTKKTAILAAAIGSLVAVAGPAFSADDAKKPATEKCYGVAKAGQDTFLQPAGCIELSARRQCREQELEEEEEGNEHAHDDEETEEHFLPGPGPFETVVDHLRVRPQVAPLARSRLSMSAYQEVAAEPFGQSAAAACATVEGQAVDPDASVAGTA